MLLLTIGLVLVGFVLLVIGLITETTFLFYVSIGFSVIAGLVLLVSSRLSRREAPAAPGMAPAGSPAPPPPPPAREPVPATVGAGAQDTTEPAVDLTPPPPPPPPPPSREPVTETLRPTPPPVPAGVSPDEDAGFPIADYDELRVSEILPLLPELDLDELEVVRDREQAGKNRSAVIDRIDDLIEELEAEELEVEELEVERVPAGAVSDDFPIEGYDTLTAEEILPLLPELEDDELDMVAEREEQGQNRAVILDAIDDMFEEVEVVDEELAMPTPAPAKAQAWPTKIPDARTAPTVPTKKVAAKKVAAKKKVPAKRAVAKKVGVKKLAPVKKVGVKKLAPVKKVGVKKLPPVKKVGVKKTGLKKVAAKKVSPVKKVTVKKGVKAVKKR